MYGGAGPGSLLVAASAWDALAADLSGAAASFDSVVSGLAGGAWLGPSSVAMMATATPYVAWLSGAAAQAEAAAAQARAAAMAFETAFVATVPPAAVLANRVRLMVLIATNFLGQNTPAIAMTELEYAEMWAQDVAAMAGYDAAATSVASALPSFSAPPASIGGFLGLLTTPLTNLLSPLGGVFSAGAALFSQMQSFVGALFPGLSSVSSLLASTPVSTLTSVAQIGTSVAQIGMYPATALVSPMMMLAQGTNAAPALAGATNLAAQAPNVPGSVGPGLQPVGGFGTASATVGSARLVGAISVPPTWQGSIPMPTYLASSAVSGLAGPLPTTFTTGGAVGPTGANPTTPVAMGGKSAKDDKSDGTTRRGGENPHVVQSRPKVVPRTRGR